LRNNVGYSVELVMIQNGFRFKNKNILKNLYNYSINNNKNLDIVIYTKLLKNAKKLARQNRNHKIYKEIKFYNKMNKLARKYITLDFNCN
jgi:hypothetical protein